MTKRDALRLKPGDKVVWKESKWEQMTVVEVIPEPTTAQPRGRFPLIVTDKYNGMTYLGLIRVPD